MSLYGDAASKKDGIRMSTELVALVEQVSPYAVAAIGAYGSAVLVRANDEAADKTVNWGRKILQRVFGTAESEDQIPEVVGDLAADPDNSDLQAALRVSIGKILQTSEQLAAEVRTLVEAAHTQVVSSGPTQINATAYGQAQQAVQGYGVQNNTFSPPQ